MDLGMNNFKNSGSSSEQKLYHFQIFSQQLFWQKEKELKL